MAPELLEQKYGGHTNKVDVFATGKTILQFYAFKSDKPTHTGRYPDEPKELIKGMTHEDPGQRWSHEQVHAYVQENIVSTFAQLRK